MNPSPFHGIFSSFGDDSVASENNLIATQQSEEETATIHKHIAAEENDLPLKGQIAVDIYEQDSYYIIRAPIAGVKLSDLDIEVDDKVLTLRGMRRLTDEVPDEHYYLQECFWGEFCRSITLPCSIDPKKVKATFSKDGILKVLIPKEEKVKIVRVYEG